MTDATPTPGPPGGDDQPVGADPDTTACPRPDQPCSRQWDAVDAPVWGTATPATFWLCLEQPGPWGARAFVESRLDARIGARLDEDTRSAGGRALLIRAVGDRRQGDGIGARRVFVAGGGRSGGPWLLQGLIDDPAVLLRLPWAELAAGDAAAVRAVLPQVAPCPSPLLFVCTNGKRDQCCATRGRAVAAYAAGQRGDVVWECTHTGGHRYAPTGLVLPQGAMFARLDGPLAVAALDAAGSGRLPDAVVAGDAAVRHLRGVAHLDPAEQAAEAYVRAATGETSYDALSVTTGREPHGHLLTRLVAAARHRESRPYVVRHRDGRSWPVVVTARTALLPPASCGTAPAPQTTYVVSGEAPAG